MIEHLAGQLAAFPRRQPRHRRPQIRQRENKLIVRQPGEQRAESCDKSGLTGELMARQRQHTVDRLSQTLRRELRQQGQRCFSGRRGMLKTNQRAERCAAVERCGICGVNSPFKQRQGGAERNSR